MIEISTGKIRGRVGETISQKQEYISFQGIPYAKPPVDDLRFLVRKRIFDKKCYYYL